MCACAQWSLTLRDPMDCSPQDFLGKNTGVGCHILLQGIFPAQGSNPHLQHQQVDSLPLSYPGSPGKTECWLSHFLLFVTPWTVAHQAPPSMEFSRQEYWSGVPFPSAGDLPNPGIEPGSPTLWADTLLSEPPGNPKKWERKSLSRVWLFATPWTVAHQAPQSMEFSRQEYWSGLPFPSPIK